MNFKNPKVQRTSLIRHCLLPTSVSYCTSTYFLRQSLTNNNNTSNTCTHGHHTCPTPSALHPSFRHYTYDILAQPFKESVIHIHCPCGVLIRRVQELVLLSSGRHGLERALHKFTTFSAKSYWSHEVGLGICDFIAVFWGFVPGHGQLGLPRV